MLKKNAHAQNEQTIKCYVCHQLTRINEALKKHAHDQNKQTMKMLCITDVLKKNAHDQNEQPIMHMTRAHMTQMNRL